MAIDNDDTRRNNPSDERVNLDPAPAMAKRVADEKTTLRRILAECRSGLPAARAAQMSALVQHNLIETRRYAEAACVILYASKDNEVATELIFEHAIVSGRLVFYPRIVPGTHQLTLVRVQTLAELQPGEFGILEPTGAEIARDADLERALICVPGVAFGPAGQRLGRGGGYYDRLIAALSPQTITVGLAYSFQVLDRLPEAPSDRRLGLIVTESAVRGAAGSSPAVGARMDSGG
jgi:5-formyltetrahydrofolate cyclo-ligase